MTSDEVLSIHRRIQAVYGEQLAELAKPDPDLAAIATLAEGIDEACARLADLDRRVLTPAAAATSDRAAAESQRMHALVMASLLRHRDALTDLAARDGRAGAALRAYGDAGGAEARYVDQRR